MSFITPIQPDLNFNLNEQEVLEEIQARILLESEGVLDDFSPASPLSAITEGQAYATALVANNMNALPEQFVFQFLATLGLNLEVAKPSRVPIEFTKTPGFNATLVVPKGFTMFTPEGTNFRLDEQLVITQGLSSGLGYATSSLTGRFNNVQAGTITGFSLPLPGLASITNPSPARGAADREEDGIALSRGLSFLQFRHLVSQKDYETAAQAVIGNAYVVKAYSYFEIQDYVFSDDSILLSSESDIDSIDEFGRRNIYLVTSDGEGFGINEALRNQVRNYVTPRIQSGTEIKFISPDLRPITIDVVAAENPPELNISRMVAAMRQNQSVLYRGIGRNLSMDSFYQVAERFFVPDTVTVNLVDDFGDAIVSITNRDRSFVAQSPATVYVLGAITVTTSEGIIYTYDPPALPNQPSVV